MKGTFETPYGSSLIGLGGGSTDFKQDVDKPFPGFARFARPGNVDLRAKLPEAIYPNVPTMAGTHIPKTTEAPTPTETLGSIVGAFLDKLVDHIATETATKVIKQLDATMAKLQGIDLAKLNDAVQSAMLSPTKYPDHVWGGKPVTKEEFAAKLPANIREEFLRGAARMEMGMEAEANDLYDGVLLRDGTEMIDKVREANLKLQDELRKLDVTIQRFAPGPVSIIVGDPRSAYTPEFIPPDAKPCIEMSFYAGGLHSPMGWVCEPTRYCVVSGGRSLGYASTDPLSAWGREIRKGHHVSYSLDEVIMMVKSQILVMPPSS